jgi:hypothetical protein
MAGRYGSDAMLDVSEIAKSRQTLMLRLRRIPPSVSNFYAQLRENIGVQAP